MERDYLEEVKKALSEKDRKLFEKAIIDLFEELIITAPYIEGRVSEPEAQRRNIIILIYMNLIKNYDMMAGLNLNYDEINYWILELLVFNKGAYVNAEIAEEAKILIAKGYELAELMYTMNNIIYKLVDSTYKTYTDGTAENVLMPYDLVYELEKEVDNEIDILINFIKKTVNIERTVNQTNRRKAEMMEKFIGNPLDKRRSGNLEKYKKVAYLIKVFDSDFTYLNGIQKKACEIADCSEQSFSKWKNAKRKSYFDTTNSELYFKWQNEMPQQIVEKLRDEIKTYLNIN